MSQNARSVITPGLTSTIFMALYEYVSNHYDSVMFTSTTAFKIAFKGLRRLRLED